MGWEGVGGSGGVSTPDRVRTKLVNVKMIMKRKKEDEGKGEQKK